MSNLSILSAYNGTNNVFMKFPFSGSVKHEASWWTVIRTE